MNLEHLAIELESYASHGEYPGFELENTEYWLPCAFCKHRGNNQQKCIERGCKI